MTVIRPIAAALTLALAGAAMAAQPSPAQAQAQSVDLSRFDGRWFEVVRNPNRVQRSCTRLAIDWTAQAADRYSVLNTCTRTADGEIETLRANARVTDTSTNAKFRMTLPGVPSFGGLASQNYWVWDHAPDYSWAIMGLPNKSYWWFWTRTASPSAAQRTTLVARARELGFNTTGVVHTGR